MAQVHEIHNSGTGLTKESLTKGLAGMERWGLVCTSAQIFQKR